MSEGERGKVGCVKDIPGHGSQDNQVSFLFVISNDGILHVTVKTHAHKQSSTHTHTHICVRREQRGSALATY